MDYLDPDEASTEHRRLQAISAAYHRVKHPEWYKNAEPLYREAKKHLEYARDLVASGRSPQVP